MSEQRALIAAILLAASRIQLEVRESARRLAPDGVYWREWPPITHEEAMEEADQLLEEAAVGAPPPDGGPPTP